MIPKCVSLLLQARDCVMDSRVQAAVQQATGLPNNKMFEMYGKYWHPFGLLLTDMEKEGMSVNRSDLPMSASLHAACV